MSKHLYIYVLFALAIIVSGCVIADFHFYPSFEKRPIIDLDANFPRCFPFIIDPAPYRTSIEMPKLAPPSIQLRPTTAHKAWVKVRHEGLFSWPVVAKHFWISSSYGPRKNPDGWGFHSGIDMAAPKGTPVYAAKDGVVREAAYSASYGNYIILEHEQDFKTRYAHLDSMLVEKDTVLKKGDLIGRVGATGSVRKSKWGRSASHLHFEVHAQGKPVDPFCYLI